MVRGPNGVPCSMGKRRVTSGELLLFRRFQGRELARILFPLPYMGRGRETEAQRARINEDPHPFQGNGDGLEYLSVSPWGPGGGSLGILFPSLSVERRRGSMNILVPLRPLTGTNKTSFQAPQQGGNSTRVLLLKALSFITQMKACITHRKWHSEGVFFRGSENSYITLFKDFQTNFQRLFKHCFQC